MNQVKKIAVGSTLVGMLTITTGCGGGGGSHPTPATPATQQPTNGETQVEGQNQPPLVTEPTATPPVAEIIPDSPPPTDNTSPVEPIAPVKNLAGSVALGEVDAATLKASSEMLPYATIVVYQYPKLRGTPLCEASSDYQGAFLLPETCFPADGIFVVNVTGGDTAAAADVRTITSTTANADARQPLKDTLHGVFTYQELMEGTIQLNLWSEDLYQRLDVPLNNTADNSFLLASITAAKADRAADLTADYADLKNRLLEGPVNRESVSEQFKVVYGTTSSPLKTWKGLPSSNEYFTPMDLDGDDLVMGVRLWTNYLYEHDGSSEYLVMEENGLLVSDPLTLARKNDIELLRYTWWRGVTVANDLVFVYHGDRINTGFFAYDISDQTAPIDRGFFDAIGQSELISNNQGERFFVTTNAFHHVGLAEPNTLDLTDVAELNQSALTTAQTVEASGDTAYVVQRAFTPGIAKQYRVAKEDLHWYIEDWWDLDLPFMDNALDAPEAPFLTSLSADARQEYHSLGQDMLTDDRYLTSDILLAALTEQSFFRDSDVRTVFSPSYLADSLVYTIEAYDTQDATQPKKLSVPIRKQGQFIESLHIHDHWLTLLLRSDTASKSVDRVELWDISEPAAPAFIAGFDEAEYPLLVSPKTRFISRDRAISLNKDPHNPLKNPAVRLFDTTDAEAILILQTATLPYGISGDSLVAKKVHNESGVPSLKVIVGEDNNHTHTLTFTALNE